MKVSVSTIAAGDLEVDLLVIPTGSTSDEPAKTILKNKSLALVSSDFSAKAGDSIVAYTANGTKAPRVALVGLGDEPTDLDRLRTAAATAAALARRYKSETVGIVVPATELDAEQAGQALAVGFVLGLYSFDRYKTQNDKGSTPGRLVLQATKQDKAVRQGAERGKIIADAVSTARDLVNLSPNEKTATLLAKAAEQLGSKTGFECVTWDKALIEDEGMGGLLAVNKGSTEPPTFSILEWHPENAVNKRPIVLVGKGVVFDTGGLSLKPTKNSMDHMKADMAGAAAVIGTFEAIAKLDMPLHVVGMIPATDNRPGVDAYVPGEVVKMHSGATVEVLNTDAEGRMLLADALSYAKTYKPDLVVDVATLTGSAVVALGNHVAAVMTNETDGAETRIRQMVDAGRRSGDRVHPMPMFADYREQLKSTVADLKNVGGREGGAITAAKFLEHFVDYPWIHVDIAGPAFLDKEKDYRSAGGTGFGVHLLIEFLLGHLPSRKSR